MLIVILYKITFFLNIFCVKCNCIYGANIKVVWNVELGLDLPCLTRGCFVTCISLFPLFYIVLFPNNAKITLQMLEYLFLDKFMILICIGSVIFWDLKLNQPIYLVIL